MGIEDFAQFEQTNWRSENNIATKLINEPSNISWWQIVGKLWIGIVVWWIITTILFMITTFMNSIFSGAMINTGATINPIISIVLLFIGFLSTFIGNLGIAWIYNIFFSRKYINWSKIFGLLLLTNGLLFFIFAPIYFIFSNQIQTLFIIMGFHIVFSIFISSCQIEFSASPNYSGSSLIGNTIWLALSIVVYSLFYKQSLLWWTEKLTYLLMLLPTILGYTLIPLGASIWEKIYYKSYELWNNALYLNSETNEINNEDEDEINVEE